MCGIAGIVGNDGPRYGKSIKSMLKSLSHRGPDGVGEDYFSHCALGHVRLSIVDLANGKQPMRDFSQKISVTFNGEIYGYREIKESCGTYSFRTECDTEVLLALYQKYKYDMLRHLPGMFAFALWDEKEQSLFCARDRFGEKPLFYAFGKHGQFIFASEIKGILASGLVRPELDYDQLVQYLSHSYIYPTRTIYKNIFTLPPAHSMIVNMRGEVKISRYWNLPKTQENLTLDEAVEKFRYLFSRAVRRQLIADVSVGAFLSGGLDSGSVVAAASEFMPKLTTISFGFQRGVNELPLARSMSEKYNTNHIELHDNDFDIVELMFKMQEIYDEPMADPASIPAYLIAKEAKKYIKVVLTGDAGDELLGGYDTRYRSLAYLMEIEKERGKSFFWQEKRLKVYNFFLKVFHRLRCMTQIYSVYAKERPLYLEELRRRDIEIKLRAFQWAKKGNFDIVDLIHQEKFFSDETLKDLHIHFPQKPYQIQYGFLEGNQLDNAIRLDLQEYLPGNGMRKTDRTTMAVGLESRTPFLDVDLAEFCISLPFHFKVHGKEEKFILKKAFSDKWTPQVRDKVKNGFSPPMHAWMREKKFLELEKEYLEDRKKKIFQILNYEVVQQIRKTKNNFWQVWELLCLSMWFELHPCSI